MKAYKGFKRHDDGTLWCQNFQYEFGKTYKYKGNIKLCSSGFHACHELYQTWVYYPNNGENVFYEVECSGKIIESSIDSKLVCSKIRLVREIDMSDVAKFWIACNFSEGFSLVQFKGKFNFIDTSGKLLSPKQWYDEACSFSDGFALVRFKSKWNFINTKGNLLSKQGYNWAGEFVEGLAEVRFNNKWCKIDKRGRAY